MKKNNAGSIIAKNIHIQICIFKKQQELKMPAKIRQHEEWRGAHYTYNPFEVYDVFLLHGVN